MINPKFDNDYYHHIALPDQRPGNYHKGRQIAATSHTPVVLYTVQTKNHIRTMTPLVPFGTRILWPWCPSGCSGCDVWDPALGCPRIWLFIGVQTHPTKLFSMVPGVTPAHPSSQHPGFDVEELSSPGLHITNIAWIELQMILHVSAIMTLSWIVLFF